MAEQLAALIRFALKSAANGGGSSEQALVSVVEMQQLPGENVGIKDDAAYCTSVQVAESGVLMIQ